MAEKELTADVDSIREMSNSKGENRTRAYHFVPAQYGLDDLCKRRLKIALIDDLNDPFDLWAIAQPDRTLRQALRSTKAEIARRFGILCFSLTWQNPLLWSHYADRHRGVTLGFDIHPSHLKNVRYVSERPAVGPVVNLATVHDLLYTKYIDWSYEQEARVFTSLDEVDPASGLYFAEFGQQCVLREVIVGALSPVTEAELRSIVGQQDEVSLTKARLAFNSFRIVKNKLGFQKV
jgi:hypothetical protein